MTISNNTETIGKEGVVLKSRPTIQLTSTDTVSSNGSINCSNGDLNDPEMSHKKSSSPLKEDIGSDKAVRYR